MRTQVDASARDYDLNRAAELEYGTLPELQRQLRDEEGPCQRRREQPPFRKKLDAEDIAEVVASGRRPGHRMRKGDRKAVADGGIAARRWSCRRRHRGRFDAVRRARAGLKDPRRPIGSFIFLGPTAVGTTCWPAPAEFLFDDDDAMTRIDMSEYMRSQRLPPRRRSARLRRLRRGRPAHRGGASPAYQVVLFDEIEKPTLTSSHPAQILEEYGRLTDNQGRTIDFKTPS